MSPSTRKPLASSWFQRELSHAFCELLASHPQGTRAWTIISYLYFHPRGARVALAPYSRWGTFLVPLRTLRLSAMQARLLLKNAKQIVRVGGGSKPKIGTDMNQVLTIDSKQIVKREKTCWIISSGSRWYQPVHARNFSSDDCTSTEMYCCTIAVVQYTVYSCTFFTSLSCILSSGSFLQVDVLHNFSMLVDCSGRIAQFVPAGKKTQVNPKHYFVFVSCLQPFLICSCAAINLFTDQILPDEMQIFQCIHTLVLIQMIAVHRTSKTNYQVLSIVL